MKKPLVSIIVCIYNSEKYLDRCLSSLVNQTLKDIEIILVNDASPDNSKDIMEKYASQDSRIVTIYNEVNGTPNPGNAGILAATADYFGFVDADDWVELDMYEKLYEKTNKGTIDVVISDLRWINDKGETLQEEIIYTADMFEGDDSKQKIIDKYAVQGGRLFTNIWKKSIVVDNSLFFLNNCWYSDSITGLWYMKANSFAKVNKIMYNYYQNQTSVTNKKNNMRIIHDRPFSHEYWLKKSKECHLYDLYKDVIDFRFYEQYLRNTCMIFAMDYTIPRYKEINALKRSFKILIPNGIKGNRFYKEFSNTGFDKLFERINKNTFWGATIVWLRINIKRVLKK